ncbi:hypothetical protein GC087_06610 [Pantoea sp. JZ2]|uniref:hypothetical protein n=1 Tax=Pantoea sp. JZ2 TaxID=2654189 RepID=UPI002B4A3503|nr:hypothetical protein [Pantoea sp. JZ2]WRH12306.1 hypothetical protein GC087_06610 [Pantoea sp. JZ2]
MTDILERNRTRLVNCYLAELVSKRGAMIAALKLPDGSIATVQLDSEILNKALIKLFERAVYKVTPGEAGEREIASTYSDCVRIKSGKITEIGTGFMGALISNLVEMAEAEKRDK